jgi:hypothetical protein
MSNNEWIPLDLFSKCLDMSRVSDEAKFVMTENVITQLDNFKQLGFIVRWQLTDPDLFIIVLNMPVPEIYTMDLGQVIAFLTGMNVIV